MNAGPSVSYPSGKVRSKDNALEILIRRYVASNGLSVSKSADLNKVSVPGLIRFS